LHPTSYLNSKGLGAAKGGAIGLVEEGDKSFEKTNQNRPSRMLFDGVQTDLVTLNRIPMNIINQRLNVIHRRLRNYAVPKVKDMPRPTVHFCEHFASLTLY